VIFIGASIPSFGLTAEVQDVPDPAFSQALAAEEADLNLSLIEPSFHAWACNAR
jgi:DNA-binding transcriptional LysR family regulator